MLYQSPLGIDIDFDLLWNFERGLNAMEPEKSQLPCRVLGYGEISTVFEIKLKELEGLAFKRMSIFETAAELEGYLRLYLDYNCLLEEEIGLRLPPHGHAAFTNLPGRPIFYIIQKQVPSYSIGSKALHLLPPPEAPVLFRCVLRELFKVWDFNRCHPERQVAVDGQISNWAVGEFDPQAAHLDERATLLYLDTSTPQVRLDGVEQLDGELFLRAAPSFLAWIIHLLFLEDVMTRYYDARKVSMDLLANVYKEQRPDLVPGLVATVNEFFATEASELGIAPLLEAEIRAYYRQDALIWSLYLSMRRFDRFLHHYLLRRQYPYILPGRIRR